jgi:hypothetical protein
VCKVDNLTTICEPIVWRKCGSLDILQLYGSPQPVTRIALPLPLLLSTLSMIWSNFEYDLPETEFDVVRFKEGKIPTQLDLQIQ